MYIGLQDIFKNPCSERWQNGCFLGNLFFEDKKSTNSNGNPKQKIKNLPLYLFSLRPAGLNFTSATSDV